MKALISILLVTMLSGCATTYQFIQPQKDMYDVAEVDPDTAQIVFLRPSKGVMGAFNSIVFDISNGKREILGVAPAKSKFSIKIPPGEYQLLSTMGLVSHVMNAKVEAGKRYYVLVRPIYGNGLQLRPIKHDTDTPYGFSNSEFSIWKSSTKIAIKAEGVNEWYEKYSPKVEKTIIKAKKVWEEKNDSQRSTLTLTAEDAE